MTPTPRKNKPESSKTLELDEIAKLVKGELAGDPHIRIKGVAGIKDAQEGDITFLSNSKYLPFLEQTKASAVIVSGDIQASHKALIKTAVPSQAFTQIVDWFLGPSEEGQAPGIHPTAVIDKNVIVGSGARIGAHAVVEENTTIGKNTSIGANTVIGRHVTLGQNVKIYPLVSIRERTQIGSNVIIHSGAVIGSDGFGYETVDGRHLKIPQVGFVLIEDDVEIGANVCVDRGRFQKTWIKKGTKIDNLVQIAHNVVIGENSLVVSQAGISGSTELGKNNIIAGQAGLVGHLTLGDNVVVCARSGVTKSLPDGSVVLGEPARPISEQKRILAAIARLPEIVKKLMNKNS
ncbi:MAG: UDP-3-O-(3-hydroxymyristoyl)glucosamine N-acyltransferase [Candidatus Omnitrophica bacterium]|nr:UDP-3-O-(3-hydroxymyristoyl)glucosamine N-acyltransferase [Candidatus Omnitrophota bacterium]